MYLCCRGVQLVFNIDLINRLESVLDPVMIYRLGCELGDTCWTTGTSATTSLGFCFLWIASSKETCGVCISIPIWFQHTVHNTRRASGKNFCCACKLFYNFNHCLVCVNGIIDKGAHRGTYSQGSEMEVGLQVQE